MLVEFKVVILYMNVVLEMLIQSSYLTKVLVLHLAMEHQDVIRIHLVLV